MFDKKKDGDNLENEQLVKLIRKGVDVQKNYEILFAKNKKFILYAIKRLGIATECYADALQDGYFAIREAVTKFDFSAGVAFTTYLMPHILNSILKPYKKQYNTAGLVISPNIRTLYYKARKAQSELYNELQRSPTVKEISDKIHIPQSKIDEVLIFNESIVYLDKKITSEDGTETTVGDMICDNAAEQDFERIDNSDIESVVNKALAKLSPSMQQCIRLKFYDELPYSKIGQVMNISAQQARQIVLSAITQLRKDKDILSLKNII